MTEYGQSVRAEFLINSSRSCILLSESSWSVYACLAENDHPPCALPWYRAGKGDERGAAAGDVRFALCYPDVYEIGMSYFGLFLLYELLNNIDGVWCERCFAPWLDMDEYLRSAGLPLFTLESHTPLGQMDAVGFSLGYELNVTNVLNMLSLSHIPIRADEREDGPLVIGGGPLMLNPTPFERFFDLIVVGEAEGVLPEIARPAQGAEG